METINYGIDLGTTNSLIAKYNSGSVEVFKNPLGFKETLPSCIAFRAERILIGDKAREWILKDPLNVFAGFKRKMGTSSSYFSPAKNTFYSPVQLSAMVLQELKNFVHTIDKPKSVVITIPASFDTIQSNATKKAGYEAGFEEVVLLQEPIAASLAFFNKLSGNELSGKWLVYDLGGGTFDVALIGISDTEMRVIDHQGDNFLGGIDFDHNLVMEVILPKLIAITGNTELTEELNKREGKFEKLYYILLLKAEEAKKELSGAQSVEIEFSFDADGTAEKEFFMEISRDDLIRVIKARVDSTLEMTESVMRRNNLLPGDINEIIMIGGSTYIPFVRERVAGETGIKVNCSADPTTAVAVGAAFYAGSKAVRLKDAKRDETNKTVSSSDHPSLQLSYNKSTRDLEEYISANVLNYNEGYQFRITRLDGGFDSGLKKLSPKFGEFVSLRPNVVNVFKIKIYDANLLEVESGPSEIEITHGLFNLFGQPLPEDISIEVDDVDNNSTKCELIFARNSILPLVKTIYREVSRTIKKNSDDRLIINLLEGNSKAHPNTNQGIGVIEINGAQLQADLIRGSDVEIKIEMSESRDVSVKVNLLLFNQQFSDVFSPTEKYVSLQKLREEIKQMRNTFEMEVKKAADEEDFERASEMQNYLQKLERLFQQCMALKENDLSDLRFQLDEQKRKLAQQVYSNENNPRVIQMKTTYYDWRGTMDWWCENFEEMPAQYKKDHEQLKEKEADVFRENSIFHIDNLLKSQMRLINKMILYTSTLTARYFHIYASLPESEYTDLKTARDAIKAGEKALERQNYDELRGHLTRLFAVTKDTVIEKISGTGLG